jgi:hypothetical protein
MLYDAFICHASEDKDSFVRPLAEALAQFDLHIWYDEFALSVGDSLRRSIDEGLAKSRFGIVVLSPPFFRKGWAQRELDGLVARQVSEENRIILPVWHNIGPKEILQYSPPLADTVAVKSSVGIENVCKALVKKLRPDESPLIAARDELIRRGIEPPVISDEWWLDVVEASNRIPNGGAYVPPETCWGSWTFPLPCQSSFGLERGLHLAWTAMQLQWSDYAEINKICQITEPQCVHDFISRFPGLAELCQEYPHHVAFYAPQLTISEFSGFLSSSFDRAMTRSIEKYDARRTAKLMTEKATDNKPILCDEEWSLRHPDFGNYDPAEVACFFVQGEMFSPKNTCFENFEYLVWLLSEQSNWLSSKHREYLISGMSDWAVWPSPRGEGYDNQLAMTFFERLYAARSRKTFRLTKGAVSGLESATEAALSNLQIKGSSHKIAQSFVERGIIDAYFVARESRRRK